jgi:hypothetical protein
MTGKTIQKSPRYSLNYGPVNRVVLFTNARDEKNIKEWVAHHFLLGFHNIVIFDHKSKVPISDVLRGFDKRVSVLSCMLENPVKLPLMDLSIKISKNMGADWMLYLDADEFLVLPRYKNVIDLLSRYKEYDSVSINWLMFGTNNIIKDPEGLIIDNFIRSSSVLDQHVKSFVRPTEAINAWNPHYFNIYDPSRRIGMNGRIVESGSPFHPFPVNYLYTPAYIAHFVHQSEETYLKRKVLLPRDDNAEFRGDNRSEIHSLYNEVENLQVKSLYSENLNKFLELKEGKTDKNIEEIVELIVVNDEYKQEENIEQLNNLEEQVIQQEEIEKVEKNELLEQDYMISDSNMLVRNEKFTDYYIKE